MFWLNGRPGKSLKMSKRKGLVFLKCNEAQMKCNLGECKRHTKKEGGEETDGSIDPVGHKTVIKKQK